MSKFGSRTALVTGAAGNIGSTVAKRLASDGADLFLTDISHGKLQAFGEELRTQGARIEWFPCDVTDFDAVSAVCEAALHAFGSIDLLFNNAGYQGLFTQVDKYDVQDFAKVIDVNVVGIFNVLRAVSERMIPKERGAIVNTASMAGVSPPPNMPAYATSKAAVIGLTSAAALDLAPHGIRVNAISPAFMGPGTMWDRQVELQARASSQYYANDPAEVACQMIGSVPMRRLGTMEEIAGVVSFLLSEDASYLTGVNIPISGGIS